MSLLSLLTTTLPSTLYSSTRLNGLFVQSSSITANSEGKNIVETFHRKVQKQEVLLKDLLWDNLLSQLIHFNKQYIWCFEWHIWFAGWNQERICPVVCAEQWRCNAEFTFHPVLNFFLFFILWVRHFFFRRIKLNYWVLKEPLGPIQRVSTLSYLILSASL